jgi:uncharacterized membrane protein
MTAANLTALLAVLLIGVTMCVAPALTRPTLQFGVRVPGDRAGVAVIQRERRAYYWRTAAVAVGGAVAAVALMAGTGSAGLTAIVLPVELAGDLACFWRARRKIAAAKTAEDWFAGLRQTVAADTSWRSEPLRYPVAWLAPAVAVLVATVIIGAVRYPDLPGRLAVGFTASGAPDRWAGKSLWRALAKVAGQLWVTGLWAGLLAIIYRSRPDTDATDPAGSTRRYRSFLITFSRALLVLVTLINVSLLLAALREWQLYRLAGFWAVLPIVPGAAGLLILLIVAVRVSQAGCRRPGRSGTPGPLTTVNRDDDRFWKGGLVYVNRDDPAIMVGTRFGLGWTPNLGNLRACLLYGGIVAAVVALIAVRAVAGA